MRATSLTRSGPVTRASEHSLASRCEGRTRHGDSHLLQRRTWTRSRGPVKDALGDLTLQSDPLTNDRYTFVSGNPVSNIEFDGHKAAGQHNNTDPGADSSGAVSDSNKEDFADTQHEQGATRRQSLRTAREWDRTNPGMLGTSSTAPTGTRAWSDAASGSGHTKNFTRRQFWEDQLRSKGSGQMTPEEEIDAAVDDVKNAVSTLSRGINCNAGGFTFQRYKCPTNSEKLQAAGTVFSYSRGGRGRGSASGAAKGGPRSIDDLDLDELSASGAGRVGRKLEQHQGGPFPPVRGGPAAKERLGQEQLDDILTHPGSRVEDTTGGAFKGGFYVIAPDGRGAAFDASRKFLYFGEFK